MTRCNTKHAPWYIVPANRKWYRNLVDQPHPAEDAGKDGPAVSPGRRRAGRAGGGVSLLVSCTGDAKPRHLTIRVDRGTRTLPRRSTPEAVGSTIRNHAGSDVLYNGEGFDPIC